jgi:hypothetical protein
MMALAPAVEAEKRRRSRGAASDSERLKPSCGKQQVGLVAATWDLAIFPRLDKMTPLIASTLSCSGE